MSKMMKNKEVVELVVCLWLWLRGKDSNIPLRRGSESGNQGG